MAIIRSYQDIDSDTGEIVKTGSFNLEKPEIEFEEKDMSPFGTAIVNYKSNFKFVKHYVSVKPKFKMNSSMGHFYTMANLLHYRVCALGYFNNKLEFIPYSGNKIIKYLEIEKSTFYKFRTDAVNVGAVARVSINGNDMYLMNPAYIANGGHLDFLTYIVFSSNKDFMRAISDETKRYIENEKIYAELRNDIKFIED